MTESTPPPVNQTSAAVDALLLLGKCAYRVNGETYPLWPVLAKYKEMQAALQRIFDGESSCEDNPPTNCVSVARNALEFDPAAQ